MALRATYGNVPAAVDWIIRRRDEKATVRAQEQDDLKRRKLQKRLGVTENGDPVSTIIKISNTCMIGPLPALCISVIRFHVIILFLGQCNILEKLERNGLQPRTHYTSVKTGQ